MNQFLASQDKVNMLVLEITEKFQIHLMEVNTDTMRLRDDLMNAFLNVHQMLNHLYGLYKDLLHFIYIYIYIYIHTDWFGEF